MDLQTVSHGAKEVRERKTNIMHEHIYVESGKKLVWMKKIYLQSKNRDMDLGNKGVDTEGEGGDGMLWEVGTDIHALLILGIK